MAVPKISVVMNCFNGEAFLRQAIESVISQTRADWEIVFWDNASTDHSAEIVQSYPDTRIKYFRADTTSGLGEARNLAIQEAVGDYVAFLDCDDVWTPERLAETVSLLETHPETCLCFSNMRFINQDGDDLGAYFRRVPPHRGWVFSRLIWENFIPLSAVTVRRKALVQVGGFDSQWHLAEDFDLWLKLAALFPIDYVNGCLVYYRMHSANESLKYQAFGDEVCAILHKLLSDENVNAEMARLARMALFNHRIKFALLAVLRDHDTVRGKELLKIAMQLPERRVELPSYLFSLVNRQNWSRIQWFVRNHSRFLRPKNS